VFVVLDVELFIDDEVPGELPVWFVPAVGFVLEERLPLVELLLPKPFVELPVVPATEPQGCPLKPVVPDIDGLFSPLPELVPGVLVDPGVPDKPDPLLVLPLAPMLPPLAAPPLAPPALPPALPPPWAKAVAVPPIISAAAMTDRIFPRCLITSTPVFC